MRNDAYYIIMFLIKYYYLFANWMNN